MARKRNVPPILATAEVTIVSGPGAKYLEQEQTRAVSDVLRWVAENPKPVNTSPDEAGEPAVVSRQADKR
ncbi:hypothetical protein [Catellatospora sichuanensis]|uniref:hypothetical protein n=1 Tax=Catellatospora sichuanensis TaxID=1969805 RepID=UPI001183B751|nr:hypothetical protein [Catellatospora sichuanensis]